MSGIINSPFMSRLMIGIAIYLIFCVIVGGLMAIVTTPFEAGPNVNEMTMTSIVLLIAGIGNIIGLLLLCLFTSRRGLRTVDRWFTPKYYRHLVKHHSSYTPQELDALAVKHVMITANVLKICSYIVIAVIIIKLLVLYMMITIALIVIGAVASALCGPTWHFWPRGIFFPTHWYYN